MRKILAALLIVYLCRREQSSQIGPNRLRLASKLQRSRAARDVYAQQVRIRQLCGHAPERECDDAGGHLAHAEPQQQHAAIPALAHEAFVSSEALSPCRALQKRVVAHPRRKLPAAVRASGDILAADLEPRHAREHALDVGTRVEELVAAWLLALKVREASLIAADPLGGKRLLDLGVHIGAQDEVVLMADEGPQVEVGPWAGSRSMKSMYRA